MSDLFAVILKRNKKKIIILAIFMILSIILQPVSSYLNGQILDNLILRLSNSSHIFSYILVAFIIIVIMTFANYKVTFLKDVLETSISNDMIKRALNHIENLDYKRIFELETSTTTNNIINDSNTITSFFFNNYIYIPITIILLAFYLLYILYNSKSVFLILFLNAIILLIIFISRKKYQYKTASLFYAAYSLYFGRIFDVIFNIKSIQIYSLYDRVKKYRDSNYQKYFSSKLKYTKNKSAIVSLEVIVSYISQLTIILVCSNDILNGRITIGDFVVINSFYSYSLSGFKNLLNFMRGIQEFTISSKRYMNIFRFNSKVQGESIINKIDKIEIKGLNFSFKSCHRLFKNFSISFNKGNIYGIIGPNGSGKTTLINIILGLYDIEKNTVFIDDISINQLNMKEVRKKLISVSTLSYSNMTTNFYQNVYLNSSTCSQNHLSEYALESIRKFEDALANIEYGTFSFGEAKKSEIINLLMKDADVYLFDEPTIGLDDETQCRFINILKEIKNDKIIVLTTHERKLLNFCDYIIDITQF